MGVPFAIKNLNGFLNCFTTRLFGFSWICHLVRFKARNFHHFALGNNAQTNVVYSDDVVKSSIPILLRREFPSAVVGRIWAIVINSTDRMNIGWAFSHVGKEIFKTFAPSITHRNSSGAIVFIYGGARVVAAEFKIAPSLIFWRTNHTMFWFASIIFNCFGCIFLRQTATDLDVMQ